MTQTPAPLSAVDRVLAELLRFRVRMTPLERPDEIQRSLESGKNEEDVRSVLASCGYRVIDIEKVTA